MREVLTLERFRSLRADEVAALLAVRKSDGASAHDDEVLAAWLGLDAANVRAWETTQRAWRAFDEAKDDEILNAMREEARKARPSPAFVRPPMAIAAAVLVLLTGGLFAVLQTGDVLKDPTGTTASVAQSNRAAAPQGVVTYATVKGQRGDFALADGSRLTLDTDSKVDVAFAPQRRNLHLVQGRAFFDVKPDPQRPFSVRAAGREVVAMGTRFDVRLDPGLVRVVLVEGRVWVRSSNSASPPTVLRPGQQLTDRSGLLPVVSPARLDEAMNWQRGFVTFDDDTLAAAAAELNRYGGDQLVVRDPRVASLHVTGMFRAGDAARFGRTLAQIHPVRVVRIGAGQLEIVPAS